MLRSPDRSRGAASFFSTRSPPFLHLVEICLTARPVHHRHQDDEVMAVRRYLLVLDMDPLALDDELGQEPISYLIV